MGLIVDSFCGGGGASTGIERALGRHVDIAINHSEDAILMHKTNHPHTKHYIENVWEVDPKEATQGKPVELAWFSPDCTHFSKAKGAKPKDKNIRGLAWVAIKWAKEVRPNVIILENVEEFKTWGELDEHGQPIKERKGAIFVEFISAFKRLGYDVDFRELIACDYGAPTTRKRFFLIARCDGMPIVWPQQTHGKRGTLLVEGGILKPYRSVAECIDWSIPCQSIFNRKKPLVEKTMQRIARGIEKFIINNPNPYIVEDKLPFLIQYHSETRKGEVRGQKVNEPIATLDTSNRYGLVTAFISKYFGGNYTGAGSSIDEPLHTITAVDHNSLVQAFLIKYYGQGVGQEVSEPLGTITSREHFGLVMVHGEPYQIVDIGMRMLTPRELFRAQGFPEDYIIDRDYNGNVYGRAKQVERVGNSVCPDIAEALVRANLVDIEKRMEA